MLQFLFLIYFSDAECNRFSLLQMRASSSEESGSVEVGEVFSDLKEKVKSLLLAQDSHF